MTDERRLVLFSAGTFLRDPHHHESPIHRKQSVKITYGYVMSKDFKRVILIVQRISPVQQKLKKKSLKNGVKTLKKQWLSAGLDTKNKS